MDDNKLFPLLIKLLNGDIIQIDDCAGAMRVMDLKRRLYDALVESGEDGSFSQIPRHKLILYIAKADEAEELKDTSADADVCSDLSSDSDFEPSSDDGVDHGDDEIADQEEEDDDDSDDVDASDYEGDDDDADGFRSRYLREPDIGGQSVDGLQVLRNAFKLADYGIGSSTSVCLMIDVRCDDYHRLVNFVLKYQ
jgi:hypothetical protein